MSTNKKNDEFGDGDVPLMMVLMVVVLEAMLFSKKNFNLWSSQLKLFMRFC